MATAQTISELNWNLLRTFCIIAEERSITGAAKHLQMSQPSVSLALQKLEEQLGCKLVFRDPRRFALTLRGEKIYQECSEMFRCVNRIGVLSQDESDDEFGELKLSMVTRLQSPLVDEALRLYHQRYPSVTWHIDIRTSLDIVRQISMQKAGIGICLLTREMPTLRCRHLFREEFGVFCGAEHPLFGVQEVNVHRLQQEPFIAFDCANDAASSGFEPMIFLREGLGLGRRVSGWSHELDEVRRMLISGLGIGLLPVLTADDDVAQGRLWPLRLFDQPLGADVYLVSSSLSSPTPPEQKFLDLIEELLCLYPDMS
ncbi:MULTISPECIES: LysR family transcriptional regulator [Mesorhizobium]|uniref:LysR family transcriptional regulator n=1 Tax=Mesorhizobium TaxID=68287 RepID=UPI0007EDD3D7|nr:MULTISPECIES: LysR family transcriptional regulator [Mesorhizobium]PBB51907.1 LysR family transcriptional regulator [Mesorhizobium loti]QIA25250.1 LysR family transcriptional regulator [Mesorhizobium sp. AA22]